MKKQISRILLITILIFGWNDIKAQIKKGNWNLGGSIQAFGDKPPKLLNYEKNKTNIDILPKIGYLLTDKFELGITTGYAREKTIVKGGGTETNVADNFFKIEPYARIYKPINEKLFFAVEGTIFKYTYGKGEGESIGSNLVVETKFTNLFKNYKVGLFVKPSLTYFLSKKIAIEGNLGSIGFGKYRNFKSSTSTRKIANTNNDPFTASKLFAEETVAGYNFDFKLLKIGLGLQFYL